MTHGTVGGYTNHRCRCRPCRDAFACNHRDWLQRQKAAGLCVECKTPTFGAVRCERHMAANQSRRLVSQPNKKMKPRGRCALCLRSVAVCSDGTAHAHRAGDDYHSNAPALPPDAIA